MQIYARGVRNRCLSLQIPRVFLIRKRISGSRTLSLLHHYEGVDAHVFALRVLLPHSLETWFQTANLEEVQLFAAEGQISLFELELLADKSFSSLVPFSVVCKSFRIHFKSECEGWGSQYWGGILEHSNINQRQFNKELSVVHKYLVIP